MEAVAYINNITITCDGTTYDWEGASDIAERMMDAHPLTVKAEWQYEFIDLETDEHMSKVDLMSAFTKAQRQHDRATPRELP